jgi:hypothetical protein
VPLDNLRCGPCGASHLDGTWAQAYKAEKRRRKEERRALRAGTTLHPTRQTHLLLAVEAPQWCGALAGVCSMPSMWQDWNSLGTRRDGIPRSGNRVAISGMARLDRERSRSLAGWLVGVRALLVQVGSML